MSLSFYLEEWKEKFIVLVTAGKGVLAAIGATWSKLFPWPTPFLLKAFHHISQWELVFCFQPTDYCDPASEEAGSFL